MYGKGHRRLAQTPLEELKAEEYGRHVHHEGYDEDEFRYLPCLCNPPHRHSRSVPKPMNN